MAERAQNITDVSILVADDDFLRRSGLCKLLEAESGWKIVAEARDGVDAVFHASCLRPNIVIMDLDLYPSVLDAANLILSASPDTAVLVFNAAARRQAIAKDLELAVQGYIQLSDAETDLVPAVETMLRGGTFFSSTILDPSRSRR